MTAGTAVAAKIVGVVIAPGLRGIVSQRAVDFFETANGVFAYALALLLGVIVCAGSYELSRAKSVNLVARGAVVLVSGLVIALAAPALLHRLHTVMAFGLAIVTGLIGVVAGIVATRAKPTRAVGVVVTALATCAISRAIGWELAATAADHGSASLHETGRLFTTSALVVQSLATLLAAAWLGTRSKWLGRFLANGAIVVAFAITYLAARSSESATIAEAVLKNSLSEAAGNLVPPALRSIAAFLVPVSILLAIVALLQRNQTRTVVAVLAFALLSHGAFDVPLQALLLTAAAQWVMLATDERAVWSALTERSERASGVERRPN